MRRLVVLFAAVAACKGGSDHVVDATHDSIPAGCGDGVKMGTEACDGTDLGSATCGTALAPGWVGVVSCTAACEINVAGCSTPATTYNSLTDSGKWSSFDLTSLYPGAKGFIGAAFDGRYMYFSPSNNGALDGIVARYDTQGGFGSSQSWITFDVSTVDSAAKGFEFAAFDGRYIYLVPYASGTSGTIARYDTQAAGGFGASASWLTFDITTLDPTAHGYVHSAFDGRYLYLVPHYNGTAYHGVMARYDTQGTGLSDPSAWTTLDISTFFPSAKGYLSATFDGRYIYYAPYYNGAAYHGLVLRYDTQDPDGFKAMASWKSFNMQGVNADAVGFFTVQYDGQYLYFPQYYDGVAMVPAYAGLVMRYDTHQDFNTNGSWTPFDVGTSVSGNAKGFIGATFDGRYLYLSPYYNGVNYDGTVAQYDTQGAGFTVPGAWSTFDTSTVNTNARGFQGAAFDGEYVYLVPAYNAASVPHGNITRFQAKSPSWLPRDWNAAFN